MTGSNQRSGGERSRLVAGRGRVLAIAAGVVLILAASVALAFVLGGGLEGASTPTASPRAAVVTAEPGQTSASTASPAATLGTGSASPTAGPASTATPESTPTAGVRAKRIHIDRLGIDLAIVEGDGIDAPIGKAAHFPGSGWPGGGTNIYIYGHAQDGMFITLWDARKGDTVVLDLIDGTHRTYVVTKVLPKVPWDAVEYLDPTPTEQLTLQTSTSYYATAPRFVVIAVPQS